MIKIFALNTQILFGYHGNGTTKVVLSNRFKYDYGGSQDN